MLSYAFAVPERFVLVRDTSEQRRG